MMAIAYWVCRPSGGFQLTICGILMSLIARCHKSPCPDDLHPQISCMKWLGPAIASFAEWCVLHRLRSATPGMERNNERNSAAIITKC